MKIETVEHDIPTMVHPVRGNSQEVPVNIENSNIQHDILNNKVKIIQL